MKSLGVCWAWSMPPGFTATGNSKACILLVMTNIQHFQSYYKHFNLKVKHFVNIFISITTCYYNGYWIVVSIDKKKWPLIFQAMIKYIYIRE